MQEHTHKTENYFKRDAFPNGQQKKMINNIDVRRPNFRMGATPYAMNFQSYQGLGMWKRTLNALSGNYHKTPKKYEDARKDK